MDVQKKSRLAGNEAAEPEIVSRAPGSYEPTAIENDSQVVVGVKLTAEQVFDNFVIADAAVPWPMLSMEEIIDKVLDLVLAVAEEQSLTAKAIRPISRLVIRQTNIAFRMRNDVVNKQEMGTFRPLTELTEVQVAQLVLAFHNIKRIAPFGLHVSESFDQLAVRDDQVKLGVYLTDASRIEKLIRECKQSISGAGVQNVRQMLHSRAPRVAPTSKGDPKNNARQVSIPVANGVFDRRIMALRPYADDEVFLSRIERDFPERAPAMPTFVMPDGSTITYEEWELDLFKGLPDQEDVHRLMTQVISAAFRPEQKWNCAVLLYSTSGNSGKSSLLELIENLYGRGSKDYASIPIAQFGVQFGLAELMRARLVLSHENSVSEYSRNMASFKAAITGEGIPFELKGKDRDTVRWNGFIIQAMNSYFESNDKSGSLTRRLLWVPFPRNFEGSEIPEIKEVFLGSDEVLDYAFYRALMDPCEKLSNPLSCQQLKNEASEANNPVQEFWNEMSYRFVWDEVPLDYLFDLCNAWRARYIPNSLPMNRGRFRSQLEQIIESDPNWSFDGSQKRVGKRLHAVELLIHDFQLTRWSNPNYQGSTPNSYSTNHVAPGTRLTGWAVRTSAGMAEQATALVAALKAEEEEALKDREVP